SGDSHRPPLLQRPQHRFDETAVAIAAGAITVGTDIRQLALGIPDRQGRTAWPVGPACRQRPVGQLGEGTAGRRLAAAADKLHALGAEAPGHVRDIGFVAGVARAPRLPDMHHLDLPGGKGRIHLRRSEMRHTLEGAGVITIEPPPGPAEPCGPAYRQGHQQRPSKKNHACPSKMSILRPRKIVAYGYNRTDRRSPRRCAAGNRWSHGSANLRTSCKEWTLTYSRRALICVLHAGYVRTGRPASRTRNIPLYANRYAYILPGHSAGTGHPEHDRRATHGRLPFGQ